MHLDLLASKAHHIEVFAPYRALTPYGTEPSVAAIAHTELLPHTAEFAQIAELPQSQIVRLHTSGTR